MQLTPDEIRKEIKRERELFIKYHALHQSRLNQLKQRLKHAKRQEQIGH